MPSPRSRTSRGLPAMAAALLGSLVLAACGGGSDDPAPRGAEKSQETGEQQVIAVESPLTGLELKGKAPRHPVLAVKIDNTSSSRPQVGLGSADLVAEELVEGGMTRLAAFFYSTVPAEVGPVRSMRATDIGIVQPLDAVLVASGGAPPTVARFREAGIRTATEGAAGYYRASGRYAPYNLFMRLVEHAKTVEATGVPEAYFPFGEEPLPKGRPASTITTSFSGGSSTSFQFDKDGYVNTDTYAGEGDQFRPRTILALRVPVGDAGYTDGAGNPVPETRFTGSGPGFVFTGGRAIPTTWSKDGLDSTVELAARDGSPLTLPPGKVWLALVPASAGNITFGK